MALLLSILHTIIFIALLSMVGQLVVGLFAWRRRHDNAVYRLLILATRPLLMLLRRLLPARMSDAAISVTAFVLLLCGYLGVGLAHRSTCLRDLAQPGCEKWLAARRATSPAAISPTAIPAN